MSKLPLVVIVVAVLVGSFVIVAMPAANALTKRDYSYGYDDSIRTARLGNNMVCGDHICAPGEWDKLITTLNDAQRGQQAGRNMTQTGYVNATSASSALLPTTAPSNVCDSIRSMLSSAGVSSSVEMKVMTDLGCS